MVTARLLSVNVGLPRDIEWQGKTIHTAVWKAQVQGPRAVRRLTVGSVLFEVTQPRVTCYPPAAGNLLICCSQPNSDVVIDL
jgi:MOSC domain-containing protein YiiM